MIDACDEFGILVWHDFQFACGSYPTYPSYLKSVEEEARQNVRLFRAHPSLLIWAGNNEDYQVQERYKLDYDYKDKDPESWLKSSFPARYIYEYLLPKIVKEEDPLAIYHPSSPWGDGKPTADPTVGDIHQWNRMYFSHFMSSPEAVVTNIHQYGTGRCTGIKNVRSLGAASLANSAWKGIHIWKRFGAQSPTLNSSIPDP